MQPTTTDFQNKPNRAFQTNLEIINEEKNAKQVLLQPTKVDGKRDIQVLTLNDDEIHNLQSTNKQTDEVPF